MRLSNIELLRIISMFLVLVVHAGFKSIHVPTVMEIDDMPLVSFSRFLIQALAVVCVNLFVLTSGWFGINVNLKKFSGFLFQILFFVLIGYIVGALVFSVEITSLKLLCLDLWYNSTYWFIRSYIILYFFSPVLNAFVSHSTSRQLFIVILSFFLCQFIFGWYFDSVKWYANGYSPFSFMGLYLLARYIKLYSKYESVPKLYYLSVYLVCSFFIALICYKGLLSTNNMYSYNCPIVILSSVAFFLFFAKMSFKSSLINNIAKSCFAVYLFHCHPFIFESVFCSSIKRFFEQNTYSIYLLYSFGVIVIFFITAVILDRMRIALWNRFDMILFKNNEYKK